jgi:hypothetical protein
LAQLLCVIKGSGTSVSTTAILNTIELAKQHEQKTRHLENMLKHQFDQVHMAIQLPPADAINSLLEFIIAYIEHVPDFLGAAREVSRDAGIEAYTNPCLKLAEDYFLKPLEIVCDHVGLDELMDEAYLAHRLLEEVNDRFMARTGTPLIPMDTTLSNLIIHNLIGEPFSNELDEAVHYSIDQVAAKESVYDRPAFKQYLSALNPDEPGNWPCLMDKLSIKLQLSGISL